MRPFVCRESEAARQLSAQVAASTRRLAKPPVAPQRRRYRVQRHCPLPERSGQRDQCQGGEPEVVELRETLSNEGEITICSELTCKSGHRIITYIIIAIRTHTTLS